MTQLKQIYKCNVCGNIVEVLHDGVGELVCCGQPMELENAKTKDEGTEKHQPVIEKQDGKVVVKVGATPHPMEEAHFIEWIALDVDGKTLRQKLSFADEPKAEFAVIGEPKSMKARIYCNVHGLWES